MADYNAIANADYVIDGFVEAHDELQEHNRSGSEAALRRAAAALCRALTRLDTDDAFWDDVNRVPWTRSATGGLSQPLADVDSILGVERDVLIEAGVPPAAVDEILRDAAVALNAYADWPDSFAASQVRDALSTAARAACIEASFRQTPRRTGRLRRAGEAAAGGVIIVANGIASLPGVTDLSIVLGGMVIVRSGERNPHS